ncbi:hypothetical protein Trydic_g18909 [Trypoxylus dichotomus]
MDLVGLERFQFMEGASCARDIYTLGTGNALSSVQFDRIHRYSTYTPHRLRTANHHQGGNIKEAEQNAPAKSGGFTYTLTVHNSFA